MRSKNSQENEGPMEIVSDSDSGEIIDPMAIKSVSELLLVVDSVMRFSQQHFREVQDFRYIGYYISLYLLY